MPAGRGGHGRDVGELDAVNARLGAVSTTKGAFVVILPGWVCVDHPEFIVGQRRDFLRYLVFAHLAQGLGRLHFATLYFLG